MSNTEISIRHPNAYHIAAGVDHFQPIGRLLLPTVSLLESPSISSVSHLYTKFNAPPRLIISSPTSHLTLHLTFLFYLFHFHYLSAHLSRSLRSSPSASSSRWVSLSWHVPLSPSIIPSANHLAQYGYFGIREKRQQRWLSPT